MKRIFTCFFSVVCMIIFCGCGDDSVGDTWYHYESDSYVTRYLSYDEIELLEPPNVSALMIMAIINDVEYGFFSTEEDDKLKYEEKCNLYNDHGGSFKWMSIERKSLSV